MSISAGRSQETYSACAIRMDDSDEYMRLTRRRLKHGDLALFETGVQRLHELELDIVGGVGVVEVGMVIA